MFFEFIKPVLQGCTILSLSVRSSSLLDPLSFPSNAALDGPCQLKPSNVPLQPSTATWSFQGGCSSPKIPKPHWEFHFQSSVSKPSFGMWSCCSPTNLTGRPHWGPHVNSLHTSSIHAGWSCDLGRTSGIVGACLLCNAYDSGYFGTMTGLYGTCRNNNIQLIKHD